MSDDEMKAELERLRSENAALKKGASPGTRMKVSDKGAVSVYGMGRFPVTLYKEQWLRLTRQRPLSELQRTCSRVSGDFRFGPKPDMSRCADQFALDLTSRLSPIRVRPSCDRAATGDGPIEQFKANQFSCRGFGWTGREILRGYGCSAGDDLGLGRR